MKRHDPFFVHRDIRESLAGEWECGENLASPVIDLSKNNNDGTIDGATRVQDDDLGGHSVLSFDGIDDHVNLGALGLTDDANPMSLVAIFKTSVVYSASDSHKLIRSGRYWFSFRGNLIRFGVNHANLVSTSITLNKWVFLVGTFDGTKIRFYKNGIYINSLTVTPTNYYEYGFGENESVASSWLTGHIANVRVYNKQLSLDEIKALYIFFHKKYGLKPDAII